MAGMIRCKNCGAEFDAGLRLCPYCGAANETAVKKEYEEALEEIEKKRRALVHLPKQLVRLWGKRWGRILLIFVAAVLAGGVLWAGIGGLLRWQADRTAPQRQEKHLQALEELASAEDYEGIWEYMRKNDLSGGAYSGYTDLYFASFSLSYVQDCRYYLERGGIWRSTLGRIYRQAAQGIWEIDSQLEEHIYAPAVEEGMQKIRAQLHTLLTEDLGLKETELEEMRILSRDTARKEESDALLEQFAAVGEEAAKRKGIQVIEDGESLE